MIIIIKYEIKYNIYIDNRKSTCFARIAWFYILFSIIHEVEHRYKRSQPLWLHHHYVSVKIIYSH